MLKHLTVYRVFLGIVIHCFAIATVAWCAASMAAEQEPDKQIVLGAIVPITGELGPYGKECRNGLELALPDCNERLRSTGVQLKLAVRDSKSEGRTAVRLAKELIREFSTPVIFGEVSSETTKQIVLDHEVQSGKVLVFSSAASSPELTNLSPYFVRNWPSDVNEMTRLAKYARDEQRLTNIAVVFVDQAFGRGLKNAFLSAFTKGNGERVAVLSFSPEQVDFEDLIAKVLMKQSDAVVLAGYSAAMGKLTRGLRSAGFRGLILANTDYESDDTLKEAGDHANGVIYATPDYQPDSSQNREVQLFSTKFKKKYGRRPTLIEAHAYDALGLVTSAIQSGAFTGEAISRQLERHQEYRGAAGKVELRDREPVSATVVLKTVRGGKFVPLNENR